MRAGGERAKGLLAQPFLPYQYENGKIGEVVPVAATLAAFTRGLSP